MDERTEHKAKPRDGALRPHRPWLALLIVGLFYAGAFCFVRWSESSFRYPAAIALALVTTLVLLFWLVLTAPWSRRLRAAGAVLLLLAIVAFGYAVRLDGWTGDMAPILSWRWSERPRENLAESSPLGTSGGQADFTTTTVADFPQFLGPERNGVLPGIQLARDWNAHPPREVWRRPIGAGWSGFAVVGDYAVTQEQRGTDELVVCYRVASGEPVWANAHNDVRFSEALGGEGPRATPTISAGRVYALGATGILDCLDATGNVIWSHNIVKENEAKVPEWGKSGSPLVIGNRVIVSAGGDEDRSLVAYDAESGDVLWQAGSDPSSYASPLLVTLAGHQQIVMVNAQSVVAHSPENGKILWQHAWPGETAKVTQPVPIDNERLLVAAGYGVGAEMLRIRQGADGNLIVEEQWKSRSPNPKFTNLVVHKGHVYGLDEGILSCVDLENGRRRWKRGRYGHGQILLVGDLLLVLAESGEVVLVEPSPEKLIELTRFEALSSKTWNSPTFAGKYLLVRNDQEAACFELPLATD